MIFKVNKKEYKTVPFDFNLVCEMEDMGVSVNEMGKKRFSVVRAYFALCAGISNVEAGKELEAHAIAGGNFEEIYKALNEEMDKSDFFHAISKKAETETAANQEEEKQNIKMQGNCSRKNGFQKQIQSEYHGMNFGR